MCTLRLAIGIAAAILAASSHGQSYNVGRNANAQEIAGWDIDVAPDGKGLPKGSGSVSQGKQVYESSCAACHGAKGEGKPADRLVGGSGTLNSDRPIKTIGSFWPYATTIYDYVYRAMPYTAPQSLTADQVYAVTGYLLYLNGIVGPDAVMDASTLPKVQMPNRSGFRPDARPDTANAACMRDCK